MEYSVEKVTKEWVYWRWMANTPRQYNAKIGKQISHAAKRWDIITKKLPKSQPSWLSQYQMTNICTHNVLIRKQVLLHPNKGYSYKELIKQCKTW